MDPGPDNQAEAIEDCRCNFCLCGQEISHVTVGRDWRPLEGYSPSWPVPYHKTCGLMGDMDGLARPRTCPRCGRRRGVRRARK